MSSRLTRSVTSSRISSDLNRPIIAGIYKFFEFLKLPAVEMTPANIENCFSDYTYYCYDLIICDVEFIFINL